MKKQLRISVLSVLFTCLALVNARAIESVDGVYQINTASDLVEFSTLVKNGSQNISCAITADLDFTGVTYTPIGTEQYPFKGTIDGQYHKISNLVINSERTYQGLVGYIGANGTIKNLTIDSSCSITGGDYTAAFAGGSKGSGKVYLENLGNEANVNGGVNTASIVGVSMNATIAFVIKNCYNTGDIEGTAESAALSGWLGSGTTVDGFYNIGSVMGMEGSNKLWRGAGENAKNLYDIEGVQGTSFTEDQLANGELAFILNKKANGSGVWHQTIGTDKHPVLDPTHGSIYFAGTYNCDMSLPEDYEDAGFSNENVTKFTEHTFSDGVCSVCSAPQDGYLTPVDSVYEIATAKELNWFAAYVNSLSGEKAYARLTADINFSEYSEQNVVIGTSSHDFTGWFDGQGHTVTVNYDTDQQYTALFRYLKNGTVKNLIVDGDNVSSNKHNAGIVANMVGYNSRIENCISKVNLASTVEGDATMGGIAAYSGGGGIYNSAFVGSMTGSTANGCSGIIGWSDNSAPIHNCYVMADISVDVSNTSSNNIIARHILSGSSNNYYLADCGMEVPGGATQFTEEQLGNGELTYLLNWKDPENQFWFQNLDNGAEVDEQPVPFNTHGTVYAVGKLNCDGSSASGEGYSNTNSSVTTPHDYVNGICSFCGKMQEDYLTITDGYYEISTPEHLNWFAKYVNTINNSINGKLTADIDFSEYTKQNVIIGLSSHDYNGIFDGQGHSINVSYDSSEDNAALFRFVNSGTIRNLITTGEVKSSNKHNAGIVANISGTGARIENCISAVTLTSSVVGDATMGGIVGYSAGGGVYNSAFVGKIDGASSNGNSGIIGWGDRSPVIQNCYVVAEFNVDVTGENATFARSTPAINNCYYVDPNTLSKYQGTEITSDQVTSGELAFLLNGSVSGGEPWMQTIGTDNYPVPFGTAKVYATGELNCDGTVISESLTFSNTEGSATVPDHQFDEDNVCQNCGARKIETAKNLYDFADAINRGYADGGITAFMVNDIDMSEYPDYLGIGTKTNPFYGTFEGNNHVISHLTINTSTKYQGLFGVVSAGVTIKNVTLDNTCSITVVNESAPSDGAFAGAIAGVTINSGVFTFENCGNEGSVTTSGANAAGILGVNEGSGSLNLTNCYNTGKITGGKESGAICGWIGSGAVLTNCYSIGEVEGYYSDHTFTGYGSQPKFVNCYDNYGSQVTQVSTDEVKSGALCYMLNGESGGENYFQTLGTDEHPVLIKSHSKVYEQDGKYFNDVVGIKKIDTAAKGDGIERIYTIDGVRVNKLQKGVNIVRKADGSTRKVLVK